MSTNPDDTEIDALPQPVKRGRGRPRKYAELPDGADLSRAFSGVPKNGAYKHLTAEQLAIRRAYDAIRQRGRSKSTAIRHRNSPAGALPAGQPTMVVVLSARPTVTAPALAPAPEPVPVDHSADELLPVEMMMIEARRAKGPI
jgi:hypothetical protein